MHDTTYQFPHGFVPPKNESVEDMNIEDYDISIKSVSNVREPKLVFSIKKETKKHNHYHKDVSHLDFIDVYRVLDLYGVSDAAIGHAIKKLLVAGGRGAKDIHKDIQEAIDSLTRYQNMQLENDDKV